MAGPIPDLSDLDPNSRIMLSGISAVIDLDYSNAVSIFTRLIDLDPKNNQAYICRGYAYYINQEYDKALVDISEALKLVPEEQLGFYILEKIEVRIRSYRYIS